MDADDCAGELVEARQYVLEEVAADRDLTCLPRLVPHIIVRAEEDRRAADVVEGIVLDEDGTRRIDEDASGAVVTHEVVGEVHARRAGEVLHTDLSLGRVVCGYLLVEGDAQLACALELLAVSWANGAYVEGAFQPLDIA